MLHRLCGLVCRQQHLGNPRCSILSQYFSRSSYDLYEKSIGLTINGHVLHKGDRAVSGQVVKARQSSVLPEVEAFVFLFAIPSSHKQSFRLPPIGLFHRPSSPCGTFTDFNVVGSTQLRWEGTDCLKHLWYKRPADEIHWGCFFCGKIAVS